MGDFKNRGRTYRPKGATLTHEPPITVAAYTETLQRQAAPPTVKRHMAAIRMLFSWLTEKGVLAMNPAREVGSAPS